MKETGVQISVVLYVDDNLKYTMRCLESFRLQTVQDFEILVCIGDDCLPSTFVFLEELLNDFPQMQLVRGIGNKVGDIWNSGLEASKGKYVLFFNTKNFVNQDMLKYIVSFLGEKDVDAVLLAYENFDDITGSFSKDSCCQVYMNYQDNESIENQIIQFPRIKMGNVLFNKKFLQQQEVSYHRFTIHQGIYYIYSALTKATRIEFIGKSMIFFRKSEENFEHCTDFWVELLDVYETIYKEIRGCEFFDKYKKIFNFLFLCDVEEMLNVVTNQSILLKVSELLKDKLYDIVCDWEKSKEFNSSSININKIKGVFAFLTTYQKRHQNFDERKVQLLHERDVNLCPCISIIIPVYNTEKYLEYALDSILGQTFDNIEVICINDGSTDHTLDILKRYAERDRRISIFTQPNCGQSVARNRGVDLAKGKYIYFMDGDDILEKSALEILYSQSEKYCLDVVYFDAVAFSEKECDELGEYNKYYERVHSYNKATYTGKELMKQMCYNKEYIVSPCLQFIRKGYWDENKLEFHSGIIHEDNEFNFLCMIQAKRVAYCGLPLFKRRIRSESTMTQKKNFEHVYGYYTSYMEVIRWLENHKVESIYDTAINQILNNMLHGIKVAYAALDEGERLAIKALDIQEQILINHLVA